MDKPIVASARALVRGDPVAALKPVALRDDPPALALRGIAMAQLGEYMRARELLRRAARGFGAHHAVALARCVVAEAEVALAMRDLGGSPDSLRQALTTLETHADHVNARHARLVAVRRLLLLGRLDEAEAALAQLDGQPLPAHMAAVAELARAELMLRSLRITAARAALDRAHAAAAASRAPALLAEVAQLRQVLTRPAARLVLAGVEREVDLDEAAAVLASNELVLDACRRELRVGATRQSLARRPVLFALALALAQAWPADVDRESLIACAFGVRHADESYRARLRVEISRLRALVAGLAQIHAAARGFVLRPLAQCSVTVLAPPIDGEQASLVALLADGTAWSSSALAQALGVSQRTVQRALGELEAAGQVRSTGLARTQRWLAPPLTRFTPILLLPEMIPLE